MSVLVAAPLRDKDPYFHRWIKSYEALTYTQKRCCIASESPMARAYVKAHWPDVIVLSCNPWQPAFTNDRVFLITEAREAIRRYACEDPSIAWLLYIDVDVGYPPETIAYMLNIAAQGLDLVFSRRPGLISLMHRDLFQSVAWCTGVNFRNPVSYLEEHYQIERQIQIYNGTRPNQPYFKILEFEAKWLQHKDKPIGQY